MANTTESKTNNLESSRLESLRAEFPKTEVKQRDGGFGKKLDYISIDSTINRLLDTVGLDYEFTNCSTDLRQTNDGFLAIVSGELVVDGKAHYGVGADFDKKDPDKAVKTALAEAIKKAGHQLGIGLYLWDEAKREEIAEFRKVGDQKQHSQAAAKPKLAF